MRYIFDEVSLTETVQIPCKRCGKKSPRKIKVYQTINPFNKNKDGLPKTRQEIMAENGVKLPAKIKEAVESGRVCNKCNSAINAID